MNEKVEKDEGAAEESTFVMEELEPVVEVVEDRKESDTGAESREVPLPSSDPTLWNKVTKGLKDSYVYAADKTDVYTRIGKRRLSIIGINRNIDRTFNEMGEKVYNLLAAGGGSTVESDLAVNELFEKIKQYEGELTAKEAEIEQILQENRNAE